ncbi:nicotinate-nucleotide--dimethylbenzimidazole phosphoribosyltransferase [Streptomyces sp. NPDC059740]|uniref:nicotinate-nucleotide--dimethylbenzimidazole phosphoribosyltransferase n=1 Tax=Streptomyces sp. NPDC059740 TaxID=3346926 RepID=UPI0036691A02
MTDTGQVPGEGLPENAGGQPGRPQPAVPGAPAEAGHAAPPQGAVDTYPYPGEGDGVFPDEGADVVEHLTEVETGQVAADEDDLLLPGAQGAWGSEQPRRQPQPRSAPAPRRPLHMGPPTPDPTGGVVRSLADRGPAGPRTVPAPRAAERVEEPAEAAASGPAAPAPTAAPEPPPAEEAAAAPAPSEAAATTGAEQPATVVDPAVPEPELPTAATDEAAEPVAQPEAAQAPAAEPAPEAEPVQHDAQVQAGEPADPAHPSQGPDEPAQAEPAHPSQGPDEPAQADPAQAEPDQPQAADPAAAATAPTADGTDPATQPPADTDAVTAGPGAPVAPEVPTAAEDAAGAPHEEPQDTPAAAPSPAAEETESGADLPDAQAPHPQMHPPHDPSTTPTEAPPHPAPAADTLPGTLPEAVATPVPAGPEVPSGPAAAPGGWDHPAPAAPPQAEALAEPPSAPAEGEAWAPLPDQGPAAPGGTPHPAEASAAVAAPGSDAPAAPEDTTTAGTPSQDEPQAGQPAAAPQPDEAPGGGAEQGSAAAVEAEPSTLGAEGGDQLPGSPAPAPAADHTTAQDTAPDAPADAADPALPLPPQTTESPAPPAATLQVPDAGPEEAVAADGSEAAPTAQAAPDAAAAPAEESVAPNDPSGAGPQPQEAPAPSDALPDQAATGVLQDPATDGAAEAATPPAQPEPPAPAAEVQQDAAEAQVPAEQSAGPQHPSEESADHSEVRHPAAVPAGAADTTAVPAAAPGPAEPPAGLPAEDGPAGPEAEHAYAADDREPQGPVPPQAEPSDAQASADAPVTPEAGVPAAEQAPAGPPAPGYLDDEREAVHRVIRERRDIRNGFRDDPIPNEVLLRLLEAAHTAPSVGQSQPWDFVVIRSPETRARMHDLAMRQRDAYARSLPKARAKQFRKLKVEAIRDTPINIVVTADPTRGGRHTLGRHTQPQMAPYSSALAVENLWLAARAEGIGVGWVSFFDEREMVRELGLPEHLEVVAYLCVGYVDEFPGEPELTQAGWSRRRPLAWVVHEEEYGRRGLPGEPPHDLLEETLRGIRPLDAKALGDAWERQKRMTKPAGALGMLEIISAQLCGLSRKCPPPIPEPAAVAVFAGDHGVHAQGVTPWPQEVTGQMVANFLGGGAVCNAFAAQVGAEVCVVDVGVATDLPATPGLLPRRVRSGTDDFTTGPAMSREDVVRAIEVGIETARDLVAAGNKALLTGEMGIANTTASAALISVYTEADPAEVTGRGTGINDETHARKVDVVRRALELHQPDPSDPIGVLAAVGGLEHAAMVGLILGGASLRTPVILDGVSAGAAALVARAVAPEALAACIAGHRSAEPGHVAALTRLGLRPLVDLDLRLGEGTGALLALPIVQSAARAMHEVATFDDAGVTERG